MQSTELRDEDDGTYTVRELMERYHVSRGTIARMEHDGRLPAATRTRTKKLLYPRRGVHRFEREQSPELHAESERVKRDEIMVQRDREWQREIERVRVERANRPKRRRRA